jgi:hypothetical protein
MILDSINSGKYQKGEAQLTKDHKEKWYLPYTFEVSSMI